MFTKTVRVNNSGEACYRSENVPSHILKMNDLTGIILSTSLICNVSIHDKRQKTVNILVHCAFVGQM